MKQFVAFLRGINVSGQKKVPMADLRKVLSDIGFKNVQTYIQSGNLVFESNEIDPSQISVLIEKCIKKEFAFEVPVLVKAVGEIQLILNNNPFDQQDDLEQNRVYFVLFLESPESNLVNAFKEESYPNEQFYIGNDCLYLKCNLGYGNAKLNNNLIERKLKIIATTRNYRTLNKMLEMTS
ncbi:DUF1697 domain-containing protein [Maribacter sp. CXY002]|uniref:DUF1697 domain-containing protein n=1 Tax=Maribacter luteocoastalis TaxID=3407671 RepID=UPI003B67BA9F